MEHGEFVGDKIWQNGWKPDETKWKMVSCSWKLGSSLGLLMGENQHKSTIDLYFPETNKSPKLQTSRQFAFLASTETSCWFVIAASFGLRVCWLQIILLEVTLWWTNIAIEMAIYTWIFPEKNVFFHRLLYVDQRVTPNRPLRRPLRGAELRTCTV